MPDYSNHTPTSRTELILKNMVDGTEITIDPQSVVEYLLIQLNDKIGSGGSLKPSGSKTFENLGAPSEDELGNIYNITDDFISNQYFIDGSGKSYKAGTNVYCIVQKDPLTEEDAYWWDIFGASIDLSDYLTKNDASSTYLSKSDASDDYLAKTDAASTYLDKTTAAIDYLAKTDAASTYLSKSDASNDYLAKTDAASTYLSKSDASSTYQSKELSSPVIINGKSVTNVEPAISELAVSVDPVKTVEGNPIIIEDAYPSNAEELSVDLEPIQDLHGYDHPWVGGAGKNKLPLILADIKAANTSGTWSGNVYTENSVKYTVLLDNDGNVIGVNIDGVAPTATGMFLATNQTFDTDCLLSKGDSRGSGVVSLELLNNAGTRVAVEATSIGATVEAGNYGNVRIRVNANITVSNINIYPMIRLATESDATFAPYTNICPISGRTETEVVSEGRNVYSGGNASGTLYVSKELSYPIPAGTYTLSAIVTSSDTDDNKCLVRDIGNDVALGTISRSTNNQRVSITFTTTKTIETIAFYASTNYAKSSDDSFSFADIQIERGNTETAHEPYKTPNTASLSFGQTVYGCKADYKTGKVIVDRAFVTFNGGSSEEWLQVTDINKFYIESVLTGIKSEPQAISNMYIYGGAVPSSSGVTENNKFYSQYNLKRLWVYDARYSSVADWKTFLASNNLQVCYELETPIDLQLTPAELELLKGYNYITADGEIEMEYLIDTYMLGYIDAKISEAITDVLDTSF